jgi:hypothetical protein
MVITSRKKVAFLITFLVFPLIAEDTFWQITETADSDQLLISLKNNENEKCEITVNIKNGITPESSEFKSFSRKNRTGSAAELRYYWNDLRGQHAVWEYLNLKSRLNKLEFSSESGIPQNFFGQKVACITNSDKTYIGRLINITSDPSWFALEMENALEPVKFYLPVIKEILYTKN